MSGPVVHTANGAVRGRKLTSVRGGVEYNSYQGIPYAKPPVGPLRFKAPQPVEPWEGVLDATKHGSVSIALDFLTQKLDPNSSEDCLFVNVYTPEGPSQSEQPKPVMVWIHGGGFTICSGNTDMFGPDYLVTEGVVLVTLNYRLGCLGFLSLQTPEYPGNYGLKDMVMALQWVQGNISAFGGDPNNVTIFGESAGSAAVTYLLLSKRTKGLFHKAIAQSGVPFNPWALSRTPKQNAFAIAELLGCKAKDEKELMEFLSTVPADKFAGLDKEIVSKTNPHELHAHYAFVPTLEPEGPEAVFTQPALDTLQRGDFNDVPLMHGVTSIEGLLLGLLNPEIQHYKTVEDIKKLLPSDWSLDRNSAKCSNIAQKLLDFYLDDKNKTNGVFDLGSWVYFHNGISKFTDLLCNLPQRKSPAYFYQFSVDGDKGALKKFTGLKIPGVCHGDDVFYLFQGSGPYYSPLTPATKEYKAVQVMTKLWTDFAKFGNPTPDTNLWKPQTKDNKYYLDINDELTLNKDFQKDQHQVWLDVKKIAFS